MFSDQHFCVQELTINIRISHTPYLFAGASIRRAFDGRGLAPAGGPCSPADRPPQSRYDYTDRDESNTRQSVYWRTLELLQELSHSSKVLWRNCPCYRRSLQELRTIDSGSSLGPNAGWVHSRSVQIMTVISGHFSYRWGSDHILYITQTQPFLQQHHLMTVARQSPCEQDIDVFPLVYICIKSRSPTAASVASTAANLHLKV